MTRYYDVNQPLIASIFNFKDTSVKQALQRPEFWFYLALHIVLVAIAISQPDGDWVSLDWEASGAMQYFTTFFLTFYNGHCYDRYEELYPECMKVLEGVLLFVHEMTVMFKHEDLWNHRLQATKYLLASTYLFFMGITGDSFTDREWEELVRKGLLTKREAIMLNRYPGPEVCPILTTWAMYIVDDALDRDEMWGPRKQRSAHIHNRINRSLELHNKAARRIGQLMAMPIPFAYWHLMNLVFTLNFLLLSVILAGFRTWSTIPPYGLTLVVFMGLKEVSNALADPFGLDSIDFPLVQYLDHIFDNTVCLLQAFSTPAAYAWVDRRLQEVRGFSDTDMRRNFDTDLLYRAHAEGLFKWSREMPLKKVEALVQLESMQDHLKESMRALVCDSTYEDVVSSDDLGREHRMEDILRLQEELRKTQDELEKLREEMRNASPALEDAQDPEAVEREEAEEVAAGDAQHQSKVSSADGGGPETGLGSAMLGSEHRWGSTGPASAASASRWGSTGPASPASPASQRGSGARSSVESSGPDANNRKRAFDSKDVAFTNFDEARDWLRSTLAASKKSVSSMESLDTGWTSIAKPGSRSTASAAGRRSPFAVGGRRGGGLPR